MNQPTQSTIAATTPWSLRVIALLATLLFVKEAEAFLVPVAVAVVRPSC
ncbi:MAG TPA: hypothetical protein VJ608_10140 [Albitalea sp.]|nr:hypothetical protein [Albitalea sp.]HJW12895.1 hypothetical protein [Albitalea sp.]